MSEPNAKPGYIQLRELRQERPVIAIGLMSGTSVDAVDAALVEIDTSKPNPLRLLEHCEVQYPDEVRNRIYQAMDPKYSSSPLLCQLNFDVAEVFARAALDVIKKAGIQSDKVDFIGSHGQTVYHIPAVNKDEKWFTPSTLQIGDPCVIAHRTGITTVGDFRIRDMAAGGVGAPLIPFFDAFLFASPEKDVLCQNIGGIANCTLIKRNGEITAFDSGPGNMVMDAIVQRRFQDRRYDKDGEMAEKGAVIERLLEGCLHHHFFKKEPPKATGHEDFGEKFVDIFFFPENKENRNDQLATACELTVHTIVDAYRRFIFPIAKPEEVIVSGGGTQNKFLMKRLAQSCPELRWRVIDEFGLLSKAKEAAGFAVLAYATLCGIPANIPAVTGAKEEVVLGKIVPGKKITFLPLQ